MGWIKHTAKTATLLTTLAFSGDLISLYRYETKPRLGAVLDEIATWRDLGGILASLLWDFDKSGGFFRGDYDRVVLFLLVVLISDGQGT